jgi:hypothetical protein
MATAAASLYLKTIAIMKAVRLQEEGVGRFPAMRGGEGYHCCCYCDYVGGWSSYPTAPRDYTDCHNSRDTSRHSTI